MTQAIEHYYLADNCAPLKIFYHTKKPPHLSKSWRLPTVREWDGTRWAMPCFPEISKSTLSKMTYIGFAK